MCKWRTNIKWFTKALGVWATGCSERGSNKSGQVSHAWFLHPLSPKDAGISACSTFYSTFHSANTFWASWSWAALGKPKRICMYVVGTGSLRQGTRYDPKCGWTNCIIKQMAKPEISFIGVLKKKWKQLQKFNFKMRTFQGKVIAVFKYLQSFTEEEK